MSVKSELAGIAELVEAILKYLDYGDLLRCRRVSWSWNQIIAGSSILQKNLFLEPAPVDRHLYYCRLLPTDLENTAHFTPSGAKHNAQGYVVATLNPRLAHDDSREFQTQLHFTFPAIREMLSWPADGHWEQQLLMQPPCTKIKVLVAPRSNPCIVVEDEEGVRLGRVVHELRRALEEFFGGDFYLDITWAVGMVNKAVASTSRWISQAEEELKSTNDNNRRAQQVEVGLEQKEEDVLVSNNEEGLIKEGNNKKGDKPNEDILEEHRAKMLEEKYKEKIKEMMQ